VYRTDPFLVQDAVYDRFLRSSSKKTVALKMGNGAEPSITLGPLANRRRQEALGALVDDALQCGAQIATGGKRNQNTGYFFEPTVLTDVPKGARAMNEEPFGPLALVSRFSDLEEALAEANRLPYGLGVLRITRVRSERRPRSRLLSKAGCSR